MRLLCMRCSPFAQMKTPLDMQGEFPQVTLFKERARPTWLSYLCTRIKFVLRFYPMLNSNRVNGNQNLFVWISFCSIASMHTCNITFQPRFYNLPSACLTLLEHIVCSKQVQQQPIKFCIVFYCIWFYYESVQYRRNLVFYTAAGLFWALSVPVPVEVLF